MQHIRGHEGLHSSRFIKNEDATTMFSFKTLKLWNVPKVTGLQVSFINQGPPQNSICSNATDVSNICRFFKDELFARNPFDRICHKYLLLVYWDSDYLLQLQIEITSLSHGNKMFRLQGKGGIKSTVLLWDDGEAGKYVYMGS